MSALPDMYALTIGPQKSFIIMVEFKDTTVLSLFTLLILSETKLLTSSPYEGKNLFVVT